MCRLIMLVIDERKVGDVLLLVVTAWPNIGRNKAYSSNTNSLIGITF